MSKQNSSGHLCIENSEIVYSSDEKELWRLPILKVRAVGEYTTANGPYVDDYFLVFVADQSDCWYEASYYAQGNDSFRVSLGKLLERFNKSCSDKRQTNPRRLGTLP